MPPASAPRSTAILASIFLAAVMLSACQDDEPAAASSDIALPVRATDIQDAVSAWSQASSIDEAHVAAQEALNLVVGSHGPDYDADVDTFGSAWDGLLPGLKGEMGLAQTPPVNSCVEADVLGGTWDDPEARWAQAATAIDEWTPSNNTMPTLASHPQRIFGWATLTLASDSLDEAHEFAGHAQLHADVTTAAITNCSR